MIIPLMPRQPLFPAPELKRVMAAALIPLVKPEWLVREAKPKSRWSRIVRWLRRRLS